MESQSAINSINKFYEDFLGYSIKKTTLNPIEENNWNSFCKDSGYNINSSGIYLPRNQTAIVREGDILSLFHEYFGHGLYCEYSKPGQELVNLEKKLLEQEKQEFQGRQFTLNEIQQFRKNNYNFQELIEFRKKNLIQYESFAIWTEYFLSKEFNFKNLFNEEYRSLDKEGLDLISSFVNFSRNYGDLATFYAFDMKRVQDERRLLRLSKDVFKSKFDRARLILHFGSGKPFSDIDLFIASNEITSIHSNWLDIRAYNLNEIDEKIKLLEPKITFPVSEGKFISGDKYYWRNLKEKILNQEITEEAIKYNLDKSIYHQRRSFDNLIGAYLQNKNLRSSKIYLSNALAMKQGYKALKFRELIDYSHKRFSHCEDIIELKGGLQ